MTSLQIVDGQDEECGTGNGPLREGEGEGEKGTRRQMDSDGDGGGSGTSGVLGSWDEGQGLNRRPLFLVDVGLRVSEDTKIIIQYLPVGCNV